MDYITTNKEIKYNEHRSPNLRQLLNNRDNVEVLKAIKAAESYAEANEIYQKTKNISLKIATAMLKIASKDGRHEDVWSIYSHATQTYGSSEFWIVPILKSFDKIPLPIENKTEIEQRLRSIGNDICIYEPEIVEHMIKAYGRIGSLEKITALFDLLRPIDKSASLYGTMIVALTHCKAFEIAKIYYLKGIIIFPKVATLYLKMIEFAGILNEYQYIYEVFQTCYKNEATNKEICEKTLLLLKANDKPKLLKSVYESLTYTMQTTKHLNWVKHYLESSRLPPSRQGPVKDENSPVFKDNELNVSATFYFYPNKNDELSLTDAARRILIAKNNCDFPSAWHSYTHTKWEPKNPNDMKTVIKILKNILYLAEMLGSPTHVDMIFKNIKDCLAITTDTQADISQWYKDIFSQPKKEGLWPDTASSPGSLFNSMLLLDVTPPEESVFEHSDCIAPLKTEMLFGAPSPCFSGRIGGGQLSNFLFFPPLKIIHDTVDPKAVDATLKGSYSKIQK